MQNPSEHELRVPWLVNGTLAPNEVEEVRAFVQDTVAGRRALNDCRLLSRAFAEAPAPEVRPDWSWSHLARRIDRPGRSRGLILAAAVVVATALISPRVHQMVFDWQAPVQEAAPFITLSDPAPVVPTSGVAIRVMFSAPVDVKAFAEAHGARVAGGPTDHGAYFLEFEGLNLAEADAVARRLEAESVVVFAGVIRR